MKGDDIIIGLKYLSEVLKDHKGCYLRVKVKAIKDELRYAWQRAYKGYDSRMTWNIDYTFAELYLEIFLQYRKNLHSYPYFITYEKWEEVLDEMIECLIAMNYDCKTTEDYDQQVKYKNRFFQLFSEHYYDLWD